MTASRFAPAKINLFLHVGDKRADGYHNLCSLAVFADVGDRVSVSAAAQMSLTLKGPFGAVLREEPENLVMRAARTLHKTKRAHITLEKNLPVASGLGGGSSDAAATLRLLSDLWSLKLGLVELESIGLRLGADVPVCVRARPSMMRGLGDQLTDAPALPPFAMVLVNPGVAVPTPEVFAKLARKSGDTAPAPFRGGDAHSLVGWLSALANDLEAPAVSIAPAIGDAKAALRASPDCLLARMSGSGATCFGIYETFALAEAAAKSIGAEHPSWWVKPARLCAQ